MEKLSSPQAPAVFRALFPGLIDWLESPWAGPPQFTAAQSFRVEEMARDNRYVIRAELPGLDPERDIEVTVEGRTLTIHAERRQEDSGPHRSEFRYGSLTRLVQLPATVDAVKLSVQARHAGISIAPGPLFSPGGDFKHFIRINCGYPWNSRIERAVGVLGHLVQKAAK